jgi:murein L,D-transpeptidase YcbB/YkuD
MNKLICTGMFAAMCFACAGNETRTRDVRAGEMGDRRESVGNQMTTRRPGAPAVTGSPDALLSKDSVVKVQQALSDKGFSVEKNGVMDSQTTTALRSFQQREGIAATGMPDQLTLRRLDLDPREILRNNPLRERNMDDDSGTTDTDLDTQNR